MHKPYVLLCNNWATRFRFLNPSNLLVLMPANIIHIKNMVCNRCKMVVEQLFERLHLPTRSIELGEVVFAQNLTAEQTAEIERELSALGFELISDRRARIIDQISTAVIAYVGDTRLMERQNLSDFLADRLHTNYATLSSLFSTERGITIERYCILQKIERVKELLIYDELTIAEIAYQLHYSSAAHLSAQFKSVTGMSPRDFRNVSPSHRLSLDEV